MSRTLKSGLLAVAIGVAAALALLLAAHTLVQGQEGVVTATIKVNPLLVSLTVPGEPVLVGEPFTVQATVENQGESRIRRVTATLHLPTGLPLLPPELEMRGPARRSLGALGPLRSRSTEWRLQAVQEGNFVLMVTASGIDASDGVTVTSESGAPVVTVEQCELP